MASQSQSAPGWSRLSVTLHWSIVALIIIQFLDNDYMKDLWRSARRGTEATSATEIGGWIHIVAGTLILLFAAIRLWDRFANGRPSYPANEPVWAKWIAKVTHFLIYAILLAMPAVGLVAYFGGLGELGEVHEFLWTPLLVLVGVHVLGALAQHFYFKSDVLTRIVRPVS